jgi:hypothetical protein
MQKLQKAIVGILLLGLLSGCQIKMPDDVSEAASNIGWSADLDHPIPLTAIYPDTGISGFGGDDSAKIIKATTGYDITYSELSASNADNDVSNIFLNQDPYDMLKLTEAEYHPSAESGLLLDLTSLLQETEAGRILYKIIDLMPYGWDAVRYTNSSGSSSIYAVPDFGYCVMEDSAFIWNTQHLKEIGYVTAAGDARTPTTISEFTDALTKLQAKYGASNTTYHPMMIPGSNCVEINALQSAFGCPLSFFLNDENTIQPSIYHDSECAYVEYMHSLRQNNLISKNWQKDSDASCISAFSEENCSCYFTSYWWVQALINGIVNKGKLAQVDGLENTYRTIHDKALIWNTRIRGDGTQGSLNQEKAMYQGANDGISYYTAIPYYMAKDALYIIDFLSKKAQHFSDYYGGTSLSLNEIAAMKRNDGTTIDQQWIDSNVHWMQTATPAGAKDYYSDGDYGYQAYENMGDKVIYLRPYTYTYSYEIDPNLKHNVQDGGSVTSKLNNETVVDSLSGTTMTHTVNGGGIWVKLTDRYAQQIVSNSQYCNGTNSVAANVLFHLRETGFDAWTVTVPMDDTIITNPMSMMPPMKHWAPISILSRTVAKRGLATAIDCPDSSTPTKALGITRQALLETYKKGSDGTKYYYWSDTISQEMTQWYLTVKVNRTSSGA